MKRVEFSAEEKKSAPTAAKRQKETSDEDQFVCFDCDDEVDPIIKEDMKVDVANEKRIFNVNLDAVPVIYYGHEIKCGYCGKVGDCGTVYNHIRGCYNGTLSKIKERNRVNKQNSRQSESGEFVIIVCQLFFCCCNEWHNEALYFCL